jgi:t-SNARE complex subunit (syntaxin)
MKKQKIHKMESSILELTETFKGIGKEVAYKKEYSNESNSVSLETLKDIEKLQRKWIDQL